MLRVYLSKKWSDLGSAKPEVVRSPPQAGAKGKTDKEEAEIKQANYLLVYSLSNCIIWESLVGCLWLFVLKFQFLNFEVFKLRFWFAYVGY